MDTKFYYEFLPFSRILLLQNKAKETSFIGLAVLFSALFSGNSRFFFLAYSIDECVINYFYCTFDWKESSFRSLPRS